MHEDHARRPGRAGRLKELTLNNLSIRRLEGHLLGDHELIARKSRIDRLALQFAARLAVETDMADDRRTLGVG